MIKVRASFRNRYYLARAIITASKKVDCILEVDLRQITC